MIELSSEQIDMISRAKAQSLKEDKYGLAYGGSYAVTEAGRAIIDMAFLVDIYGGHYPDISKRDESLLRKYSDELVKMCREDHLILPSLMKEYSNKNPSLEAYNLELRDKNEKRQRAREGKKEEATQVDVRDIMRRPKSR